MGKSIVDIINTISNDVLSITEISKLIEYLANKLSELTGAAVVTFNEYNSIDSNFKVKFIKDDSGLNTFFRNKYNFDIQDVIVPVTEETYTEIRKEYVSFKNNLHYVTFGAIDIKINNLVKKVLKIDRYAGIAYFKNEELYGTTVLAFKKGVKRPSKKFLNSFVLVAWQALRRVYAEENSRKDLLKSQENEK